MVLAADGSTDRYGFIAEQHFRQSPGGGGFAHARRSDEDEGVAKPPGRQGLLEKINRAILMADGRIARRLRPDELASSLPGKVG